MYSPDYLRFINRLNDDVATSLENQALRLRGELEQAKRHGLDEGKITSIAARLAQVEQQAEAARRDWQQDLGMIDKGW